jgi:hypothetical protein
MDNEPRVRTVPSQGYTKYATRSTTGAAYPGYPLAASVPSYTSRYEWLRDSHGLKKFNHCEHYTRLCTLDRPFVEGSDSWYSTGSPGLGYWDVNYETTPDCWNGNRYGVIGTYGMSGQFGAWDQPLAGLPELYVNTFANGRSINLPPSSYTKHLIDRSLRAMLPGIKPTSSILNTIAELRDIKTLLRTKDRINEAVDATESLKRAYRMSSQAVKLLSGKGRIAYTSASLRTLLKAGADSYLQAQFNLLPLLKDIASVKNAISSARKQVEILVSDAGKLKTSHYRASVSDQYLNKTESKTVTLPTFMVNTSHTGRRTVRYPTRMFYATMEYRYKIPTLPRLEDYLPRAVQDVLGINLNPSIIWNALPWSFVIDWVFGVGQWLDQFAIRNIEPVTSISRYCYSYHIEREILLEHGEGSNVVPFVRFSEEAYFRTPHVPDWLYSIESSGLSPKEFSLTGALALSR